MQYEKMQIKFDGQNHQIDSNTLINVLIHYNTIISAVNTEYGGGVHNVSVKVNALEKSSFLIDIGLETAMNIFSSETVQYLAGIVTVAGGVFAAYKHFKGKPTDGNDNSFNINIKGNDNKINQSIINIYNQPIVREAISKSIETANEDVNVDSISISGQKTEEIVFEREDFADLIYTDFDKENIPDEKKEIIKNAILTIIKLSFEKGGQWQFLYNGFKIPMIVKDDALMDIINKGARFGMGDAIRVDLQVNQKYNEKYQGYENKSYRISAFYEHIITPKQGKFENF